MRSAVPYGIPVTVVGGDHRTRPGAVHLRAARATGCATRSGNDTKIEGGRRSGGDRHAIIVDKSRCRLYETWNTRRRDGRWHAGSGAVWDLGSNALRPDGWTSADAAGLPILPGLLRWREVRAGTVDHAIRFTTDVTDRRYVWPARHQAGAVNNRNYPPMGARFRLKASFDLVAYSAGHPRGPARHADVRPGARRQRLALVLPGRGQPTSGRHGLISTSSSRSRRARSSRSTRRR